MSLAQAKQWVKEQSWLRPALQVYRAARWLFSVPLSILEMICCPRRWIKRHRWRRPFVPVFRTLEWLLFALPQVPFRATPFLYHLYWFHKVGHSRLRVRTDVPGPRRIVMLVSNNLSVDPRVRHEAQALARSGFRVTIICPAWKLSVEECSQINWGENITFRILPFRAARFVCAFPHVFGREMYRAALAETAWAYHAHDLDMAFMALLAAARKGVACVCDFHEWYSENVTFDSWTDQFRPHPYFKRRLYQAVERLVIHHATRVLTVCESIRTLLEHTYQSPQPIGLVRNIPTISPESSLAFEDLRKTLRIPVDKKIVLYQGGMGPSRNLEPVIRALPYTKHIALVIRGPGHEAHAHEYRRLAESLKVRARLFCLPPVPAQRVVAEARAADAGLWSLLSDVGLNFKLALPNKVFEYLAAGIPLLVADLPEVRAIVHGYGVGLCFDPDDPRSIADGMNRLAEDATFRAKCRANIPQALEDLNADREWNKLVEMYRHLGEMPQHAASPAWAS